MRVCWGLPPRLNHQHTHTKSWFLLLYWSPKNISSRSRLQSPIIFILVFYCLFYHCQSWVRVSAKWFQSSRLSDSHAWSVTPLHLTLSQITLFITKKAKIALTITRKVSNNNNTPHNFRHALLTWVGLAFFLLFWTLQVTEIKLGCLLEAVSF